MGEGEGGQERACVCVSAHGYNSQKAEPNVPPIKVYLDQVVTGFSGGEGRLVDMELGVVVVGVSSGWVEHPPSSLDDDDDDGGGGGSLLDVVGEPAESFAVALPLQHAAHEHLQRSRVQLLHGNGALGVKHSEGGGLRTRTDQASGSANAKGSADPPFLSSVRTVQTFPSASPR